jgi:hypothetical protein
LGRQAFNIDCNLGQRTPILAIDVHLLFHGSMLAARAAGMEAGDEARGEPSEGEADQCPGEDEAGSVAQDEADDLTAARSEGNPDAYLTGALGEELSQETVEA